MDHKEIIKLSSLIADFSYLDLQKNKQLLDDMNDEFDLFRDPYLGTIAHLFLSFYCMCSNESDACKEHLAIAKKSIEEFSYQQLTSKYNFIQTIYFALLDDDQNLTQAFIQGLKEAKGADDKEVEVRLLNQLTSKFVMYDDYENALRYSLSAYNIARQIPCLNENIYLQVIYNLVEIHILTHQYEKAYEFLNLYDNIQKYSLEKELRKACNSLYLYAMIKRTEEAITCADFIIKHKTELSKNKIFGFDICKRACLILHDISQKSHTCIFLDFMEEFLCEQYISQRICYENIKMKVYTTTVNDENLEQHYREYFYLKQEVDKALNANIREGMKSKLKFFDIAAERKKLESFQNKLKEKVYIDELTGIYNRAYIDKTIDEICIENDCILGILSVDVDFLKEYNDTYGHVMGDTALRIVGECLKRNEIPNIVACRYGGDEFICICKNVTLGQIDTYVDSLKKSLYKANIFHKTSKVSDRITVSIGYYQQNVQNKETILEVFELVDQALYKSKLKGRNTFTNRNLLDECGGITYGKQ